VPLVDRENSSGTVSSMDGDGGGHLSGDDDEGKVKIGDVDSKLGKKNGKVDDVEKKGVESAQHRVTDTNDEVAQELFQFNLCSGN
jgi:hypothetical protein